MPIGIWIIPAWMSIVGLGLMFVFFCLTPPAIRRAVDKTYSPEYATYRLDSSHDRRHLRYVLFLRKLADQKYTRKDIAKLRRAVEITEIPAQPAIQFNEHPLFWLLVIVPFVGGLWTLSVDFVKQADFWKGRQETIATLSAFGVRILLSPERNQEAKSMLAPQISILRQSRRFYDCWPLKGA
jgi:hypothetical protein